jgi:uncharacterized protein (DUF2252 family)
MTRSIAERIHQFNQGRSPERMRLKYQRMKEDCFAFFRGTCHLFYDDWPESSPLNRGPLAWICGDLHLENFGSYKGENRLVHFDINDFDEAVLAPCTWEAGRFLTSILVGSSTLKLNEPEAMALCHSFFLSYASALAKGKAGWIEAETAEGIVQELLEGLRGRKRREFLNRRTEELGGRRRLFVDGKHTNPVTPEERSRIESSLNVWAAGQPDPAFFRILDIARRIAGLGSLGLDRYILLVEGKGSPDRNYILDLKEARASALYPHLAWPQPGWANEAQRIVAIQDRMQGASPALLSSLLVDDRGYVLRELQPIEDRVNLRDAEGKLRRLEKVIETMAHVTAWAQLRSSGRQGSAIADELIAFASSPAWQEDLLRFARSYAAQVEADYREFCSSNDHEP